MLMELISLKIRDNLREYLDRDLMAPLYKYLKRTRKRYSQEDFKKLYHDYQMGKTNITTRKAFANPQVFKNGWVVHFTNVPYEILTNGFRGLSKENMEYIWRTYGRYDVMGPAYSDEGYAFAYDADDLGRNCYDYGKYALVFRVSGLKVENLGDLGETQVVFNSKLANLKECFIIKINKQYEASFDSSGEANGFDKVNGIEIINPVTRKAIVKTNNIEEAIQWIKDNYRQYKGANTFNSLSIMKSVDMENERRVKLLIQFFKDNYEGRYLIDTMDDYRNSTKISKIIYDGHFKIKDFFNYYATIVDEDKRVEITGQGFIDLGSRDGVLWKKKFGNTTDEIRYITITWRKGTL